MLTAVPSYRVPRDEDGRPSREFDLLFTHAMRWWPEVTIPEDMVSPGSRKTGEPQHEGASVLHQLRDGNVISQRQLDAAIDYLTQGVAFYESNPWGGSEPYPGRNRDAASDMRNLLNEINP